MTNNIAFAVYYQKDNIYSFNALIGAIETDKRLSDIKIYFFRGKSNLLQGLKKILLIHDKVILGISFFTTQIWEISLLVKDIKKIYNSKLFIIAGGPHPSGDPVGTLAMGADLVVIGEGETTIIDLLLKANNNEDLHSLKGIGYLDEEKKYVFTGKRKVINLDDFPPFPMKNVRFGAIEITRGCPYMCYFCQTSFLFGTQPRHRSIDKICQALEFMKKHKKTDIRFITPNAFSYGSPDGRELNLSKLEELLRLTNEIIEPNGRIFLGSFPSEVRPEHVTKESIDLILNYASNDNIVIGAQSGSNKILESCHRGHNIEDVYNAVQLTINSGLKVNVDFIFGLPHETDEDVNLTLLAMKNLTKLGAKIHAHTFMPLPNTPYSLMPVKKITNKFRKQVKMLNSKGLLYGNWRKQENLAIKISKYLKGNNYDHH
ncbi:MAG: TIGR04013 family B12-binding domain/radical SAM domain-containing protein [Promethearchaeota archaeon]|nr:MAG: TIGR04013 family B12-binding domain/radical SAM domain-containing protein [Candidatus Lokiarchaeota archaeon]